MKGQIFNRHGHVGFQRTFKNVPGEGVESEALYGAPGEFRRIPWMLYRGFELVEGVFGSISRSFRGLSMGFAGISWTFSGV